MRILILCQKTDHPTLKAIVKKREPPSIIAITSEFTKSITIKDALKEIIMLASSKTMQATTEIPVKLVKGNSIFFVKQICAYFNESIGKEKFSNCLKLVIVTPVFKKGARNSKIITDQ